MPLDQAGPDADVLASFRRLVRAALPGIEYAGLCEYAVQFVDPVRGVVQLLPTSSGNEFSELPPVEYPVAAYTVAAGAPVVGATCLVAFVDWNPARPAIVPRAGDSVLGGKLAIVQTTTSSLTITYTAPDGSTTAHTIAVGGASGVVITAGGTLVTKYAGTIGVGK